MRLLTTAQWEQVWSFLLVMGMDPFFTQLQPKRIIGKVANCVLIRSNFNSKLNFLSEQNLLFEANKLVLLILVY